MTPSSWPLAVADSREARIPEHFTHYRDPVTVADLRDRFNVNVLGIAEPSYHPRSLCGACQGRAPNP